MRREVVQVGMMALVERAFQQELPAWYRFRNLLDDCLDSMDQEP